MVCDKRLIKKEMTALRFFFFISVLLWNDVLLWVFVSKYYMKNYLLRYDIYLRHFNVILECGRLKIELFYISKYTIYKRPLVDLDILSKLILMKNITTSIFVIQKKHYIYILNIFILNKRK